MAALGGIEAIVNSLPDTIRSRMMELVRALVPYLRFGPVEHQSKCENFAGVTIISTTASDTGELAIAHGLGRSPYRIQPCLAANSSGMELVNYRLTRPADGNRIYLKVAAGDTGKVFAMYVEG